MRGSVLEVMKPTNLVKLVCRVGREAVRKHRMYIMLIRIWVEEDERKEGPGHVRMTKPTEKEHKPVADRRRWSTFIAPVQSVAERNEAGKTRGMNAGDNPYAYAKLGSYM